MGSLVPMCCDEIAHPCSGVKPATFRSQLVLHFTSVNHFSQQKHNNGDTDAGNDAVCLLIVFNTCVVVRKDYSNVVNEECGQIHTRTVSVAEMSARLLSNGTVIITKFCQYVVVQ